jgi:hypothetical protein
VPSILSALGEFASLSPPSKSASLFPDSTHFFFFTSIIASLMLLIGIPSSLGFTSDVRRIGFNVPTFVTNLVCDFLLGLTSPGDPIEFFLGEVFFLSAVAVLCLLLASLL